MSLHSEVCVVGGGVGAGYLAKQFVESEGNQKIGKLVILNERDTIPFERPALSKAYLTDPSKTVDNVLTATGGGGEKQTRDWYEQHGIKLLTNTKVVGIDLEKRTLKTEGDNKDADTIQYNTLVLATGCDARRMGCPGEELDGVKFLRESRDADSIRDSFDDCKRRGGKAVVVGGGYLGMEVAAGMHQSGLDVTMVYPDPTLMGRFFPPALAERYQRRYEQEGVRLMPGGKAVEFLGDESGKVRAVKLENGKEVEGTLVLVAVGAAPRVDMFKKLGLKMADDGGVVVDSHFRVSGHPEVYAIGDIAHYPLQMYGGKYERQEHVQHARESGQHVAKHIVEPTIPDYDYLPYFYSREFSLSWKFYGDSKTEDTHVAGNMEPFLVCLWRDESKRLVGILVEGGGKEADFVPLMQRLARQRPQLGDETLQKFKETAETDVPQAMKILEGLVD